jgi:hypothetical protein
LRWGTRIAAAVCGFAMFWAACDREKPHDGLGSGGSYVGGSTGSGGNEGAGGSGGDSGAGGSTQGGSGGYMVDERGNCVVDPSAIDCAATFDLESTCFRPSHPSVYAGACGDRQIVIVSPADKHCEYDTATGALVAGQLCHPVASRYCDGRASCLTSGTALRTCCDVPLPLRCPGGGGGSMGTGGGGNGGTGGTSAGGNSGTAGCTPLPR